MRLTLPILIVIGAMGVIGPLGTDMYLPALPAMASELSTSRRRVQLTLTAFSVGLALGNSCSARSRTGSGADGC